MSRILVKIPSRISGLEKKKYIYGHIYRISQTIPRPFKLLQLYILPWRLGIQSKLLIQIRYHISSFQLLDALENLYKGEVRN